MLILVREFNDIFGIIYGAIHVLDVIIVAWCAYAMVRLQGFIAFTMGAFGLNVIVITMGIINALASVSYGSRKVLKNMKTESCMDRGGNYWGMRSYRAAQRDVIHLRDLRIWFGSSFYYDKEIVLTTLQIMLQGSVNLILLY